MAQTCTNGLKPSGVAQDPTYLGRRFYLCRPGLRFAHGTGPRASSTTAA